MRITCLQAENIKRIKAIEIVPGENNLVEITGKNGAGKTSALDAIEWALAGTRSHQKEPIRRGENKAKIVLHVGEYKITRQFRKRRLADETENVTTGLMVENKDGSRFMSPQLMIEGFLSTLTFDPLEFSKLNGKDQYKVLTGLLGIDLSEIESLNAEDYSARTLRNRNAKEAQIQADRIQLPKEVPAQRVSVAELMTELRCMDAANSEIAESEDHLRGMKESLDRLKGQVADVEQSIRRLQATHDELQNEAAAIENQIDTYPDIPPRHDTEPIRDRIAGAEEHNAIFERAAQKKALLDTAERNAKIADNLTEAMALRQREARKMVEEADMPVEGLGLKDGVVTFDGFPLDQASDAAKLRVSCAIAMRQNADLRVIRVREGSLLDDDNLKLLAEMADEHDYQVWIERVDSTGKVGFVIEDGALAGQADD